MPKSKQAQSKEVLSDGLVLAALARAELHTPRSAPGVLVMEVGAHLGLPGHSGTAKRLHERLRALAVSGLVEVIKRHGCTVYAITARGRRSLSAARKRGDVGELPEAPQHRTWRKARAMASERIGGFRDDLDAALDEARRLLSGDEPPSDAWFALGDRLSRACWRLGSATYCLREWSEPDDARADVHRHNRGPRQTWLWGEQHAE
jgi:hypothetical protein